MNIFIFFFDRQKNYFTRKEKDFIYSGTEIIQIGSLKTNACHEEAANEELPLIMHNCFYLQPVQFQSLSLSWISEY